MSVAEYIEERVRRGVQVEYLSLDNESHQHNVPAGSESHFKLVVVSPDFAGLSLVRRHQKVNGLVAGENGRLPVHALALHTFTPEEWAARESAHASPACRGGT